ncbi:MAG: hypothetical protein U0354_02310 [Candidatus Sericytochromatia bacterium]
MLDKDKLKAKREKEMEDTLNLWQNLLNDDDCSTPKKDSKKEDKKK